MRIIPEPSEEDRARAAAETAEDMFYVEHGYPMNVTLEWMRRMLDTSEQRLVKLSAMNAPHEILEGERRIISKRKGWIAAWQKEHP